MTEPSLTLRAVFEDLGIPSFGLRHASMVRVHPLSGPMFVREVPEAVPLGRHLGVEGNTAVDAVFPANADIPLQLLSRGVRWAVGVLARYSHLVREASTHR
jgi:hypothetical protein